MDPKDKKDQNKGYPYWLHEGAGLTVDKAVETRHIMGGSLKEELGSTRVKPEISQGKPDTVQGLSSSKLAAGMKMPDKKLVLRRLMARRAETL